ncbi:cytochrome c oxidase assembly protein [Sinorhizobium meliloti]|uniref:cytochrome c oxidase assembly protein n=1 Tax=Rhizobium meliloti TaxID=382 RepID=UPI000FD81BD0|nr:cytochrome c oxidase assembly protein [Sinorhizobium meliloti]MDW9726604.1 cytochrome c oxidase assembly protein [Sinorhizobium meliloti]MDW9729162.1 cytochrome c oxidase assembly protein [Sinorhizobium meliloti]MDW9788895.1 cytochrome c oxidase assembly protein [Sinorhizobium meliloti]RVG27264.1 cytochrome c oxidase assembly protein [Sinorhizobium meliloti]
MRIVFAALFTIMAADAQAHEAGAEAGDPWNYLFVVLPLALTALAYAIGMRRLWSASARGQTIHLQRAVCFAAGWLFLAAALVSPLDRLATQLFTAHMIEHEILMVIAAPLFVLSKPLAPLLWSLPQKLRASVGRALVRSVVLLPVRKAATNQLIATGLHGATLWLWHAPRLYDAALAETPVHWLQHLSFFCTALIFWWALLFGRGRQDYGTAIFYLFATTLHSGFLGILLSFAREPLYRSQGAGAASWGLSALEDQQLAGLIMWVPAGMIYVAAALALAAAWIGGSNASFAGESNDDAGARGGQAAEPDGGLRNGSHRS